DLHPSPTRRSSDLGPTTLPAACNPLPRGGTMHAPLFRLPVIGRFLHGIKLFALKFFNDWSMNLASMLAYNLITTIFPILLVMLSIVGMVLHAFFFTQLGDLSTAINDSLPLELQGIIDVSGLLRSLVTITGP